MTYKQEVYQGRDGKAAHLFHEETRESGLIIPRLLASVTFEPEVKLAQKQLHGFITPTSFEIEVLGNRNSDKEQHDMEIIDDYTVEEQELSSFARRSIELLCKLRDTYGDRRLDGDGSIYDEASETEAPKLKEILHAVMRNKIPDDNPTGMYL